MISTNLKDYKSLKFLCFCAIMVTQVTKVEQGEWYVGTLYTLALLRQPVSSILDIVVALKPLVSISRLENLETFFFFWRLLYDQMLSV